MMTIVSGVVASVAVLEDGRTQILSLHFTGDVIGRTREQPIQHELVAMTEVNLCHQPRREFSRLLSEDEGFRDAYLENAQDTIDQSRTWMLALGRKTSRERLATFLSFLLSRGVAGPVTLDSQPRISLPLSRNEIANFLGLTLETVSRQFSALKKAGIIDVLGREVSILDVNGLVAEACDDDGGVIV